MSANMKISYAIAMALCLSGCAANSTISVARFDEGELAADIARSPIVERLDGSTFAKQRDPKDIELHYKLFKGLNKPDLIVNWERYYVIGEPSVPSWKYKPIANISVYQAAMDDATALDTLRKAASDLGGSAVIELFRKPIPKPGSVGWWHAYHSEQERIPIDGYAYFGQVVRATDR